MLLLVDFVHNAAVNIGVQIFEFHLSLLVGIFLRMGLLEHMKVYVLLF